jgi:putative acetyltransferase
MIEFKRTNSDDKDFQQLVITLDIELAIRDGDDHLFYAQLNKTDMIKHVIVAYENNETVGCGAIRHYSDDTMEVKRMFVPLNKRGHGIASLILRELEYWCKELNYKKCILETGKNQPEAIRLYKKNDYKVIPNFGKYIGVSNSVCFEKELL